MRKTLAYVITLILLIALSGCELGLEDDALREARQHYETYEDNDLVSQGELADFINTATLETSRSSVKVKVNVYDASMTLVEEREASGVVFQEEAAYVHILTAFSVTDVPEGHIKTVRIHDYLEREFTGFIREESSETGLSAIRMVKPLVNPLSPVETALFEPVVGEPVLLVGFQRETVNAINMGLVTGLDVTDPVTGLSFMTTDIPSDINGNGGMIINLMHQLVGIQSHVATDEGIVNHAVPLLTIKAFIESYEG
jgi:hypothetical protein